MGFHRILFRRVCKAFCFLSILTVSCKGETSPSKNSTEITNALITFIIPTLNRPTLERTITSLINQNNPNWEAIVIFDGVEPIELSTDPRIRSIQIAKTGKSNHAGEVRNQGIQQVKTEWIGFVDDDDYLSPDYVDCLDEEIKLNNNVEVVIFRMYHPIRAEVIPAPQHKNFLKCHVGISFSMKTSLFHAGAQFKPGPTEDFDLLDSIRMQGHKMVMSPYLTYWIRDVKSDQVTSLYNATRAYIN